MHGVIDTPRAGDVVSPDRFAVAGWAFGAGREISRIEVLINGEVVGRAGRNRPRPDVAHALSDPAAELAGFAATVTVPAHASDRPGVTLEVRVTWLDGASFTPAPTPLTFATSPPPGDSTPTIPPRPRRAPPRSPARILWFARSLDLGGSQLRMAEVIEHLNHVGGYRCRVMTPTDGPLRARLETAGAQVDLIEPVPLDDSDGYERAVGELADAFAGDVDLVIGATVTSFPAVDAAARAGIPSIARIGEAERLETVAGWLGQTLHPHVAARARHAITHTDAVWCNSQAAGEVYRHQEGIDRRYTVISSGVDTNAARQYRSAADRDQYRADLGIEPQDRLIVVAATVWPIKGQATLVEALHHVHADHPNLRLALVGQSDATYTEALAAYIERHHLDRAVRIVEFCDDLRPWWVAADATACVAESEALPTAGLEAMAFALPVLATRVGDLPLLIRPRATGWLCDEADLADLIDALRALADVSPRRLRRMGRRAAAVVRRDHERADAFDQTVALFRSVLDGTSVA